VGYSIVNGRIALLARAENDLYLARIRHLKYGIYSHSTVEFPRRDVVFH